MQGHGGDTTRGYGRHGGGPRMLEAYDTNGDGKLAQEELDRGRAEQLKKFDRDGDGMLSIGEYQALWLDAMRERMDRNRDDDDNERHEDR